MYIIGQRPVSLWLKDFSLRLCKQEIKLIEATIQTEADKTGRTNEIEFEQNRSVYPVKVMSRYTVATIINFISMTNDLTLMSFRNEAPILIILILAYFLNIKTVFLQMVF